MYFGCNVSGSRKNTVGNKEISLNCCSKQCPVFSLCFGEFSTFALKRATGLVWLRKKFFFSSLWIVCTLFTQSGANLLLSNDIWLQGHEREQRKVIWSAFLFEAPSANRIPLIEWPKRKKKKTKLNVNWIKSIRSHNRRGVFSLSRPPNYYNSTLRAIISQ